MKRHTTDRGFWVKQGVLFSALFLGAAWDACNAAPAAPKETFVYIVDFQPTGAAQYRINSNGGLVPLKPARALADRGALRITVDKAGRFAYVQTKEGIISHCQINADGTLTTRRVPDVKASSGYSYLFLDEPRGMAYVAGNENNRIERFTLSRDGVLKPLAPLVMPGAGKTVGMPGPVGNTLSVNYVLKADIEVMRRLGRKGESQVPIHYDTYRLNGTEMPTLISSLVVKGGGNLTFDPNNRFAYIPCPNAIGCYRVEKNGSLSSLGEVTLQTGNRTVGMTFSRDGKFVYIDHDDAQRRGILSQFKVDETGLLVPLSPQVVPVEGILINETLDPAGRFLYATAVHTGNTLNRFVVAFRIGDDGRLERISRGRTETGSNAGLPEIDPSGRFAYISTMVYNPNAKDPKAREFNDLLQFKIEADGSLKPLPIPKIRMKYFWDMVFVPKNVEVRPAK